MSTRIINGTLQDWATSNDGADVILHAGIKTHDGVVAVDIAIDPDDIRHVAEALDEEWGQLGATSSAIDDHDEAVMRRAS